ncbi:two-component sensor histidine kinase [Bordetella sp. J329]|jgi:signal transduction histidine kinase|uniref:sensor histidine kinase n=1 Tax=Kerstersia gyiorum TaxID=206506 RepID=UPI000FDB3911|nr:HAMP domain-containing sensor histidine kinase [Kerstersia gyiorum]AZV93848.1 two-component sensor histidine kinase [Bordetella sp. J329]MCH4272426.1 HAMP domain-containing histidine kinase [Kerstersia gyiorum]MCI1229483.1 HAMP domain-containing histidine kinase [Kerstersia gyiorum]
MQRVSSKPDARGSILRRGSLARHLLVRLLPPILALVCVDIGATWVLTHKLDASSWVLEDVFWFMVAGQLASLLLFGWVLVVGVRSGLKGVTDLSESLGERSAEDLQPLPSNHLPLEIAPLVERTNELLARLDASMAAQRRFIGHAAHQFRTPLSGLKLESELMLARSLPEDIEARARRIKSVTDRMIRLGQQLLVLARVDPGVRPQDSFVSMDLCEWARHSGARWLGKAREAGLELDLSAPPHPVWIDGDPLLLDELLGNLIDNALRYATGATMLRLRIGSTPPVLVVEDDGVGLVPEEQEKIFEAFYRGPSAVPGGAGLGLAIVREIAEAHGAWWRLESRPALSGTRFSVVFPGPRKGAVLNRQERRKWESAGN